LVLPPPRRISKKIMTATNNLKDEFLKELHCPRCGHFLLKEAGLGGMLEIKCRTCKAIMRLASDGKTISIALS